jgi:hypothetical protein
MAWRALLPRKQCMAEAVHGVHCFLRGPQTCTLASHWTSSVLIKDTRRILNVLYMIYTCITGPHLDIALDVVGAHVRVARTRPSARMRGHRRRFDRVGGPRPTARNNHSASGDPLPLAQAVNHAALVDVASLLVDQDAEAVGLSIAVQLTAPGEGAVRSVHLPALDLCGTRMGGRQRPGKGVSLLGGGLSELSSRSLKVTDSNF